MNICSSKAAKMALEEGRLFPEDLSTDILTQVALLYGQEITTLQKTLEQVLSAQMQAQNRKDQIKQIINKRKKMEPK